MFIKIDNRIINVNRIQDVYSVTEEDGTRIWKIELIGCKERHSFKSNQLDIDDLYKKLMKISSRMYPKQRNEN